MLKFIIVGYFAINAAIGTVYQWSKDLHCASISRRGAAFGTILLLGLPIGLLLLWRLIADIIST